MKKYRERQAKKIYAGIDWKVQNSINAYITLWAESKKSKNEIKAAEWDGMIVGTLDCLHDLKILSIQETLLVREYTISQMCDKLENMRNGAA